jgi:hypothetical protein
MRLTIKKINKMVQEIEEGWELVKGNGYFYWSHPTDLSYLDCATIPVYKVNDLTLDQWIEEFVGRKPAFGTLAYYDSQV